VRALLLALALVLVMAAPAYAGSADSHITTPSSPAFLIDDGGTNVLITGTADFNNIDIICTYGPTNTALPVSSGLHLQSGNQFAAQIPLHPIDFQDCVLRAVPTGEPNPDLSRLTGPTVSVAYREVDTDPAPYDYDLSLAPLGGSIEFGQSSSDGGVKTSWALNSTDLSFVQLFSGADALITPPDVDSGRAAVQVDGQDAYFRSDVRSFSPDSSPVSAAPTLSFDPTNGTGGVSSQELLGRCVPGTFFPPDHTNCPNLVTNGVRLDHTGNLIDNGAIGLIDEQFTSTDGSPHVVDAWFRQQSLNVTGLQWKFPGDPGFSDYAGVVGKTVPAGPATALLQKPGPAYGSLSWSEAPDAVRFISRGTFFMHYRFTVPAGGSHVLHFAYGSSFTPEGASALGAEALARWQPAPPPGGGGGGGGGGSTPPPAGGTKLRASLGGVKAGGDGTVTVTLNAPGAGNLSASETAVVPRSAAKKRTRKLTVSSVRRKVGKAGRINLVLKLNRKGRKLLRSRHRLPVTLSVTYKPTAGSGNKLTRHLTLKLRKARHKR
jgi:hypothetical protein